MRLEWTQSVNQHLRSKFAWWGAQLLWRIGLEPLFEDYVRRSNHLREQVFAITIGVIKETTRTWFVWFFYGSECWGMRMKTIKYCFHRNSLHKVGRMTSKLVVTMSVDHTTGVAPKVEPATTWLTTTNFLKHNRLVRLDTLGFKAHCFSYLPSQNHTQWFYSVVCQLSSSVLRAPTVSRWSNVRAQRLEQYNKEKDTNQSSCLFFMAPNAGLEPATAWCS